MVRNPTTAVSFSEDPPHSSARVMDYFQSAAFTDRVNTLLESWHVPGIAIALINGEEILSRGYGSANIDPKKAMTPDAIFDIASSSKSMTAAAGALLVEDDEKYPHVQWDTPVSKLLPEDFVMMEREYTEGITVEDIVSHRSGLPSHDFSYMSPRAERPDTPQSITRNLRNLDIAAQIRSKHMYCNMMFTVAAHLVEQLSGLTFEDFLSQHFWQPLSMHSTHLQAKKAVELGLPLAQGYVWRSNTETFAPVEQQYSPEAIGAGLINTSVNDYILWVKALMNREFPITDEIYQALTKPRSLNLISPPAPFTSPELYTAGLATWWYRGYEVVDHDGLDPGFASVHFFLPALGFGGVMLSNSTSGRDVLIILQRELIDMVLKVGESERVDWESRQREEEERDAVEEAEEKLARRKRLCPDFRDGEALPLTTPLERYEGLYWNVGYHYMRVEVSSDDKLMIDATDRTMGFTMTLEHLCGQRKFLAKTIDYYEEDEGELAVEFVFDEADEKAIKMGLELEEDLEDGMIWFERVDEAS